MRRLRLLALCALALTAACAARRPRQGPSETAKAVARTARSYLPEENSGRRVPKDCSDYVRRVYAENGVMLPRTSAEMSTLGARVKSTKHLRMGDLVFFSGERVSRIVGHVGIYINNGIFIHLTRPSAGVRMESLYSDHYRKRYITSRRILK